MARMAKCKGCGIPLAPEDRYRRNSKTYCKECFEKAERNAEEYKDLVEFICENYGSGEPLEKPTGLMLKQIKEYKNEYGYTYGGMAYTLWYCKEVLGKSLVEKYGIGIVKYYYEEAGEYYLQQERIKERVEASEPAAGKVNIVKMKRKEEVPRPVPLINLESLTNGGRDG